MRFILYILILLSLSSCFDIVEKITFNADNSGKAQLIINASRSRNDINLILKSGSFIDKKIPQLDEIKQKVKSFEKLLSNIEGIHNSIVLKDYENFKFEIQFDFDDIKSLNRIFNKINQFYFPKNEDITLFNYDENSLLISNRVNKNPLTETQIKENISYLKDINYFMVYRFANPLKSISNQNMKIAGDNKGVLFKSNGYDLLLKNKTVENTIKF